MTDSDAYDEKQPDASKTPKKRKKRLQKKFMARPIGTRPIIIGFTRVSRGDAQITYRVENCLDDLLGDLTVNVMLDGYPLPPSYTDPDTPHYSANIDVQGNVTQRSLSYKVVDSVTGADVLYYPPTPRSIPFRTFFQDCPQSFRRTRK